MKITLQPTVADSIEITATVFMSPEAVTRFIRALVLATKTVWPAEKAPK